MSLDASRAAVAGVVSAHKVWDTRTTRRPPSRGARRVAAQNEGKRMADRRDLLRSAARFLRGHLDGGADAGPQTRRRGRRVAVVLVAGVAASAALVAGVGAVAAANNHSRGRVERVAGSPDSATTATSKVTQPHVDTTARPVTTTESAPTSQTPTVTDAPTPTAPSQPAPLVAAPIATTPVVPVSTVPETTATTVPETTTTTVPRPSACSVPPVGAMTLRPNRTSTPRSRDVGSFAVCPRCLEHPTTSVWRSPLITAGGNFAGRSMLRSHARVGTSQDRGSRSIRAS